jgi:hypothetical protein
MILTHLWVYMHVKCRKEYAHCKPSARENEARTSRVGIQYLNDLYCIKAESKSAMTHAHDVSTHPHKLVY